MGWVNLLQSQPQLVPVTPDIDVKPYIEIFILDVDDALYIGTHLGLVILELEVDCLWLEV